MASKSNESYIIIQRGPEFGLLGLFILMKSKFEVRNSLFPTHGGSFLPVVLNASKIMNYERAFDSCEYNTSDVDNNDTILLPWIQKLDNLLKQYEKVLPLEKMKTTGNKRCDAWGVQWMFTQLQYISDFFSLEKSLGIIQDDLSANTEDILISMIKQEYQSLNQVLFKNNGAFRNLTSGKNAIALFGHILSADRYPVFHDCFEKNEYPQLTSLARTISDKIMEIIIATTMATATASSSSSSSSSSTTTSESSDNDESRLLLSSISSFLHNSFIIEDMKNNSNSNHNNSGGSNSSKTESGGGSNGLRIELIKKLQEVINANPVATSSLSCPPTTPLTPSISLIPARQDEATRWIQRISFSLHLLPEPQGRPASEITEEDALVQDTHVMGIVGIVFGVVVMASFVSFPYTQRIHSIFSRS